jgi:hypothetical protein
VLERLFGNLRLGQRLGAFGVSALTFLTAGKSHCVSFITYFQEFVQGHNKHSLDLGQAVGGRRICASVGADVVGNSFTSVQLPQLFLRRQLTVEYSPIIS